MKKQVKPKIDPDIAGRLPALHPDERAQLKADIELFGQRHPGIVWKQTGILLDGHTRLAICEELGLPFRYEVMDFDSREEAIDWIYNNQLARRNVAKDERAILIAKRVKQLKEQKAKEETTRKQGEVGVQSGPLLPQGAPGTGDIVEQVAEEQKVSETTVKRAVAKVESNFCDRCVRLGSPVKGCPKCAEKRAKPPKKKPLKKGQALVDWKGFESALGVVVRFSNRVGDVYSEVKTSEDKRNYDRAIAVLVRVKDVWKKAYS